MNKLLYIIPSLLLLPTIAAAQSFGEVDNFFISAAGFINGILIPIILAVAFLVFVYGVIKFFFVSSGSDNADARKEGKQLMIWGIFAFVAIVSIWGIVMLIAGGLDLNDQRLENPPVTPIGAG